MRISDFRTRTVGEALSLSRHNNFDIIRFIAASFVIVSHSFAITGLYDEPALGGNSLGTLGVYIFFTISGFLVTKSWFSHPRATAFLGKRALRILPGLAAVTIFVLVVVGPLLSSLPLKDYIKDPLTLKYLGNISMFTMSYNLPGVFSHNPFAGSTNGSLWTLAYEFVAYIGLAVVGYFGFIKHRAGLIRSFAYLVIGTYILTQIFNDPTYAILDLQIDYLIHNLAYFVVGSLFYLYRDEIFLNDIQALLAYFFLILSPFVPGQWFIRLLSLPYLVIYLALMPTKHAHKFSRFGDFSYGMYVYAWPVQQTIVSLGNGRIGPLRLIFYAFPPIIILAAMSWHFVEKPSLKLKNRFSSDRYPLDTVVVPSQNTSRASLETASGVPMTSSREKMTFARLYSTASRLIPQKATWLLAGTVVLIGLFRSITTFRLTFGLGDMSTFFIFARNTARGEIIYRDFIHFRMPGFYYYCAAFLKIFGDSFAALCLAMSIEGFLLYPLVMFVSSKLITGSSAISFMAALACILVSGIFQLRAGLGLLAIAMYIAALRRPERHNKWLILAGLALGADFVEGQEVFLFATASIGLVEVLTSWRQWRPSINRLVKVATGAAIVMLPFLAFMAVFSNFRNFLYYAFDYALIIQPKYMNLPFPSLSFINWQFYLPFALYLFIVFIFFCTKRLSKEVVIVLSFGILRLATALGRADIDHMIFSIPELFFILPWALAGIKRFDRRQLRWPVIAALIALTIVFGLGMRISSPFLLLAPIILVSLYMHKREPWYAPSRKALACSALVVGAVIAVLFNYAIMQAYYGVLLGLQTKLSGGSKVSIEGVAVSPPIYYEVSQVTNAVQAFRPSTIFSYPIEPYYYRLAPHHATRFITFEPETTPHEVDEAIADLAHSKPPVVVLDMFQAEALSPSLSRLSDYITSNYETNQIVSQVDYIKIMKRKSVPSLQRDLLLDMYASNQKTNNLASYHIFNKDGTILDAMRTGKMLSFFPFQAASSEVFVAQIRALPGEDSSQAECGEAYVEIEGHTQAHTICEGDGAVNIDLGGNSGQLGKVELKSQTDKGVLWVDPRIEIVH